MSHLGQNNDMVLVPYRMRYVVIVSSIAGRSLMAQWLKVVPSAGTKCYVNDPQNHEFKPCSGQSWGVHQTQT